MSTADKFFMTLAILLLCTGIAYGVKNLWFVNNGNSTSGLVIDLERIVVGENTTYAPVVEFTREDGQKITFTHRISGNFNPGPGQEVRPPYQKGDRVTVLYDPYNPKDATLYDVVSLWLFPGVFTGVGVLLLFGVWNGARNREG